MININCDVGEGMSNERSLFKYISSCSIACGGHAGDAQSMREILKLAKEFGVAAGAHPSYPDKENFGRISLDISRENLIRSIRDQVDHLIDIANELHVELDHIKAHGALYNDAVKNENIAEIFIEAVSPYGLPLYVPYNSIVATKASEKKLAIVYEAFADRNYNEDLSLISRSSKDALKNDPLKVIDHVTSMHQGKVQTLNGEAQAIKADTFCIHSDTSNATAIAMQLFGHLILKFKPYGDQSILIEWPQVMNDCQLIDMLNFKDHLKNRGYQNIIQGVASLLIEEDVDDTTLRNLYLDSSDQTTRSFQMHIIPVCYDESFGEDLGLISTELGLSIEEIIEIHSSGTYTVYSLGFLPGFPYLGGLSKKLHVSRKAEPRISIPKGSVGIGGQQTGIYPQESPGGWQLIGRTPIDLFDAKSDPPCLIEPGDIILFERITLDEFDEIQQEIASGKYEHRKEVRNDRDT